MDLVLQHCCWEGEGFLSSLSGLLLSWLHHSTSKKHGPGLLKAVKHMLKPFQHSSEPRIVLKGGVFLSHLNKIITATRNQSTLFPRVAIAVGWPEWSKVWIFLELRDTLGTISAEREPALNLTEIE